MSSTFIFMISFLIISLDLTHIFRTSTGFSVNHSAPPPPCTDWHLHHTASCLHLQFMTPSPTLCRQALTCALGFCPLHWLGDTTAATLTSLPVSPSPLSAPHPTACKHTLFLLHSLDAITLPSHPLQISWSLHQESHLDSLLPIPTLLFSPQSTPIYTNYSSQGYHCWPHCKKNDGQCPLSTLLDVSALFLCHLSQLPIVTCEWSLVWWCQWEKVTKKATKHLLLNKHAFIPITS